MRSKSNNISSFFSIACIILLAVFSFLLIIKSVEASFIDNMLAKNVEANTENVDLSKNVLEANVSYLDILEKDKEDSDEQIKENIEINVSDNALLPTTSPNLIGIEDDSDDISIYIVREKDSIQEIAKMFNVSVNTILWENDLSRNEKLKVGERLLILPVSGVEHEIKKGQSLKSIADLYKVEIVDIERFNGITEETPLSIGQKIIVPGGEIEVKELDKDKTKRKYANKLRKLIDYFINPVPGAIRSQNTHGRRGGVDLAASMGAKVFASASGEVLFAKKGWNGAYGNLIILKHANGTKTLYAHLSKIKTAAGAKVEQGEAIGLVGSTGRSTGPHLHFEVFNAKNPASDWSWKK